MFIFKKTTAAAMITTAISGLYRIFSTLKAWKCLETKIKVSINKNIITNTNNEKAS